MKAAVEGGRSRKKSVEVTPEPALWGLVGNTPLIPLPPSTDLSRTLPSIFLKAEWFNPGGSVKDRPALFILRDGIARGELPRKRVLDAPSGNTAIAYAMLGAAAGIGVTVCVPRNASAERKALLEAHSAEYARCVITKTAVMQNTDYAVAQVTFAAEGIDQRAKRSSR